MSDVVLPDARYGVSATRHNVTAIAPGSKRTVIEAANAFNEHRYRNMTMRQRIFVDAYLQNGQDATLAAMEAGYSRESAVSAGIALASRPSIKRACALAMAYAAAKTDLCLEDVVNEIRKIAFGSTKQFWKADENGEPRLVIPEEGDDALDAVQEITVEHYMEGRGDNAREVKRVKLKMYDKMPALKQLFTYLAPKEQATPAPASGGLPQGGDAGHTTNVSVTSFNLVPVPSGQFIPAPIAPPVPMVEHKPPLTIDGVVLDQPVTQPT